MYEKSGVRSERDGGLVLQRSGCASFFFFLFRYFNANPISSQFLKTVIYGIPISISFLLFILYYYPILLFYPILIWLFSKQWYQFRVSFLGATFPKIVVQNNNRIDYKLVPTSHRYKIQEKYQNLVHFPLFLYQNHFTSFWYNIRIKILLRTPKLVTNLQSNSVRNSLNLNINKKIFTRFPL